MKMLLRRSMDALAALQFFISGLYGVLLPLAVLALLVGNGLLLWTAMIRKIDPIISNRIVSIEPDDLYLDRDRVRDFKITRELCSRRGQQVDVVGEWTEARFAGQPRPVVVSASATYELKKGCNMVAAERTVPETLPPGHYVYDVSLRACNVLKQCQSRHLDPIPFVVVGGIWRNLDIPLAASPPPPPPSSAPGLSR